MDSPPEPTPIEFWGEGGIAYTIWRERQEREKIEDQEYFEREEREKQERRERERRERAIISPTLPWSHPIATVDGAAGRGPMELADGPLAPVEAVGSHPAATLDCAAVPDSQVGSDLAATLDGAAGHGRTELPGGPSNPVETARSWAADAAACWAAMHTRSVALVAGESNATVGSHPLATLDGAAGRDSMERMWSLDRCSADPEWAQDVYDYMPVMNHDVRFGSYGRVVPIRYHPLVSSTNPAVQVVMRCNVDVSCMDRVFALAAGIPLAASTDAAHESAQGLKLIEPSVEPWQPDANPLRAPGDTCAEVEGPRVAVPLLGGASASPPLSDPDAASAATGAGASAPNVGMLAPVGEATADVDVLMASAATGADVAMAVEVSTAMTGEASKTSVSLATASAATPGDPCMEVSGPRVAAPMLGGASASDFLNDPEAGLLDDESACSGDEHPFESEPGEEWAGGAWSDADEKADGVLGDGAADRSDHEGAPAARCRDGNKPGSSADLSPAQALLAAFERLFRDAEDGSHYTGDYMTKWSERVSSVLPFLQQGVETLPPVSSDGARKRKDGESDPAACDAASGGAAVGSDAALVDSYAQKKFKGRAGARPSHSELLDRGRRLLIRLETSSNRATMKKLPEMLFQMMFAHECFMSHETWTLYCGYPIYVATRAQERLRRKLRGEDPDDVDASGPFLPTYAEDGEDGDGSRPMAAAGSEEHMAMLRAKAVKPADPSLDLGPDDAEQEGGSDGGATATMQIEPSGTIRQYDNWLLRGPREPLSSMGLYHYSMFVHRHYANEPAPDFATYLHSDLHPQCNHQVQRLRLDESFRVPRLNGFYFPAQGTNPEMNAMMKTMLFRPLALPSEACDYGGTALFDMIGNCLDAGASYQSGWTHWFDRQRVLADRFDALQRRAGKLFTLEDIDVGLDSAAPVGDREQPSAAEFMAYITVEVVTNMDQGAEAKSRPRQPSRPEASQYARATELDEHAPGDDGDWAGAEADPDAMPAGDGRREAEVDVPGDAVGKMVQSAARHPIPQEELFDVIMREKILCGADAYTKAFAEGMGKHLQPSAGPCQLDHADFDADSKSARPDFDAAMKKQTERFKWNIKSDQPDPDDAAEPDDPCQTGRSHGNAMPEPAYWHDLDEAPPVRVVVAKMLEELAEDEENPRVLGTEQLEFLALVVNHFEYMLRERRLGRVPTQRVCLLLGQGGSGKSELIDIVRRLAVRYLGDGSCMLTASSNSAARGIGGDTIHSCTRISGLSCLTLGKISQTTPEGKDAWKDVEVLVVDEISMVQPRLFGALSYRAAILRQGMRPARWPETEHRTDPDVYDEPGRAFGGIPLVLLTGDFMQLTPIGGDGSKKDDTSDKRKKKNDEDQMKSKPSLLWDPAKATGSDENKRGLRCFHQNVTDVFFLKQTFRFVDRETKQACSFLPRLLAFMRAPGIDADGKPRTMPRDLWDRLQRCVVKNASDPRLLDTRRKRYQAAIEWKAVTPLMHFRALREARERREMLMYVQGVDVPGAGNCLSAHEYRLALQTANMNKCGSRMGLLPLYKGMEVRMTAKLSAKNGIVQDATGTVESIQFHPDEFTKPANDWLGNPDHPAWDRGSVRLQRTPLAVLVKFAHFKEDVGHGKGVVAIEPSGGAWKENFVVKDDIGMGQTRIRRVPMKRYQLPLAPALDRTVNSAQGLSMDSAMMMLAKGNSMHIDDHWLNVYVLLSRVRHVDQLLLFNLPERQLFEKGPATWIKDGLARLEAKADSLEQRGRVADAMRAMPWDAAVARATSRGAPSPGAAPATEQGNAAPVEQTAKRARRDVRGTCDASAAAAAASDDPKRARRDARGTCDASAADPASEGPSSPLSKRPRRGRNPSADAAVAVGAAPGAALPVDGLAAGSVATGATTAVRGQSSDPAVSAALLRVGAARRRAPILPSFHSALYESPTARAAPSDGFETMVSLLRRLPADISHFNCGITKEALRATLYFEDRRAEPVGLVNHGNTCFVNAALQLLLRVDPLWRYLQAHSRVGCERGHGCLTCLVRDQATALREATVPASCPLALAARRGRFGEEFVAPVEDVRAGPQCDASAFLGRMLNTLVEQEPTAMQAAVGDFQNRYGLRSVLHEHVFGCILRSRLRCDACGTVSDKLDPCTNVCMSLSAIDKSVHTLQGCWEKHFREELVSDGARCPSGTCAGKCRKQLFLEKEPSVLLIELKRGWAALDATRNVLEHGKLTRPISFPEHLDFLRTGRYVLRGVLQHTGKSDVNGHYLTSCWLGRRPDGRNEYGTFDDSAPVRRLTWQAMNIHRMREDWAVLVYVRDGAWDQAVQDGPEWTPYARGGSTLDVCGVSALAPGVAGDGLPAAVPAAAGVAAPLQIPVVERPEVRQELSAEEKSRVAANRAKALERRLAKRARLADMG